MHIVNQANNLPSVHKSHLPLLCKYIVTGGVGCFEEMLYAIMLLSQHLNKYNCFIL